MARTPAPIRASTVLPHRPMTLAAYHAAVRPVRSALLRLLRPRSHPAGQVVALIQAWELLGEWLDAAIHVAGTRRLPARAAADLEWLRRRYATLGRDWLHLVALGHDAPVAVAGYAAAWGQAEAMCRELDGLGYLHAPIPATRSNATMQPPITLPVPAGLSSRTAPLALHASSATVAELRPALHAAGAALHVATVCGALAHGLDPDVASQRHGAIDRGKDATLVIFHLARRALAVGLDWRNLVEGGVREAGRVIAAAAPDLNHGKACAGTMALLDRCLAGELPAPPAITRIAKAPPAPPPGRAGT